MGRRNNCCIPTDDLALFQKCRRLNEDIAALRRCLPSAEVVSALEKLGVDNLPLDTPRKVRRKLMLLLRLKTLLDEREAEFDSIVCQAEHAAQRIGNLNPRLIAKLYFIGGKSKRDVARECSISEGTVYKWVKVISRPL